MIALLARYVVRDGMADEVTQLLCKFAPLARAEQGCAQFTVHRSRADEHVIVLYEQYVDEVALQAHRETSHFREIIEGEVVPRIERRERDVLQVV